MGNIFEGDEVPIRRLSQDEVNDMVTPDGHIQYEDTPSRPEANKQIVGDQPVD